jgi:hypothetical protein
MEKHFTKVWYIRYTVTLLYKIVRKLVEKGIQNMVVTIDEFLCGGSGIALHYSDRVAISSTRVCQAKYELGKMFLYSLS